MMKLKNYVIGILHTLLEYGLHAMGSIGRLDLGMERPIDFMLHIN